MTGKTALIIASLLLLGTGCSRASERREYAAELSGAHAAADRAATPADTKAALAALESAFALPAPDGAETTTALRQDLADRIARLYLRLPEPQVSLSWARRGLSESDEATVLRAALLITEADALEALGRRDEARAALMSALEINQALLHVELEHP